MQMPGGHLLVSGWTETTLYIPHCGMAIESPNPDHLSTVSWIHISVTVNWILIVGAVIDLPCENRLEFASGCSKLEKIYRQAIGDRPYIF